MGRALVTGSNRGIGLALCALLAERGDEVLAACRTPSPELRALAVTVVEGVDVGDPASAARLRGAIGEGPLDLVIANAASNRSFDIDRPDDLDLALFEDDVQVNVLGVVRTVVAALPSLRAGSRIALVSSGASAPGPNTAGSFGYKVTKAAVNQLGRSLASELREREIVVAIVNPGPTNTALLNMSFAAGRTRFDPSTAPDARESAARMLGTIAAATLETSGTFWNHTGGVFAGPDGIPPSSV
jgi:NAD(P)-dependent dehydrogenase (short-subunit alcohol dehydrogenase family)